MVWLIVAIAVWGLIHSWLASLAWKDFLRRRLGEVFLKSYRLLYNLFAALSFLPVFFLLVSLPDRLLYRVPPPCRYIMWAGQGLSVLLLFIAVLQTDLLAFAGLRQLGQEEGSDDLVTGGLYRLVRHPLYTFSLAFLWLSPSVTLNSFVVYVALTLYILIGIIFEERKLLRVFGQKYAEYCSVTPMLIPGIRKAGTINFPGSS